ncbi:MAG: hypothetical protein WC364_14005 [Eubacteriales bacterium]|jgi:rubrerythrin
MDEIKSGIYVCNKCGYIGSPDSFKEGCPDCGNWDNWHFETIASPIDEIDEE